MTSRWNRPVRTFVLPVLAAAAIGWVLARSIDSLTALGDPPRLLTALVYGPLLGLGDLARPPAAGLYFAALLAFVLFAGRDRRWRPLATVMVGIGLVASAAAIDIRWPGGLAFSPKSLGGAIGLGDVHLFAWYSPEGFMFITLGALAWHLLIVGCLVAAWTRRESVPMDGRAAPSGTLGGLVRVLRDVAPVPLAWAAFGYAAGACIDTAVAIGTDRPPRLTGGPAPPRLPVESPAFFVESARGPTALYFGGLALLLWHACAGPWARRRAAVWYAAGVFVQIIAAAYWVVGDALEGTLSLDGLGLGRVLEIIPDRMAFLAAGGVAWHVFAVWCLFRYRSDRAGG